MRVRLDEARTLDGFTYGPGVLDVKDDIAAKLLHNFPAVCHAVKEEAAAEPEPPAEPLGKGRGRRAAQRPPADA